MSTSIGTLTTDEEVFLSILCLNHDHNVIKTVSCVVERKLHENLKPGLTNN